MICWGAQLLYYIRLKNMTDIQFNSNSKKFFNSRYGDSVITVLRSPVSSP